jgi:hypothetical protein
MGYCSPWNWLSAFGLPGSSAWPPGPSFAVADSDPAVGSGADSELDSLGVEDAPARAAPPIANAATAESAATSFVTLARMSFLLSGCLNGHAVATVRSAHWMTVKAQNAISL